MDGVLMRDSFSRRYIALILEITEQFLESNPNATANLSGDTALIEEIYSKLHDAAGSVN